MLHPFDAKYLAALINPIRDVHFLNLLDHCAANYVTQTGRPDASTWDKKHFEETLTAYYWKNGGNNRLYPIYPAKHLIGLGILLPAMLNPEDEANGKAIVRNRLEEIQAWNRWFVEFMAEEDDYNEWLEEQYVEEQYLALLKKGGSMGTMELQRMVERKKVKGHQLCLSF